MPPFAPPLNSRRIVPDGTPVSVKWPAPSDVTRRPVPLTVMVTPARPEVPIGIAPAMLVEAPFETRPEMVAPVAEVGGVGEGVASVPAVSGAVGAFGAELPHAAVTRQARRTDRSRRGGAVMGALPMPIPPRGVDEAIRILVSVSKQGAARKSVTLGRLAQ